MTICLSSSSSTHNLLTCPPEILLLILQYCSYADFVNYVSTCRKFYYFYKDISNDNLLRDILKTMNPLISNKIPHSYPMRSKKKVNLESHTTSWRLAGERYFKFAKCIEKPLITKKLQNLKDIRQSPFTIHFDEVPKEKPNLIFAESDWCCIETSSLNSSESVKITTAYLDNLEAPYVMIYDFNKPNPTNDINRLNSMDKPIDRTIPPIHKSQYLKLTNTSIPDPQIETIHNNSNLVSHVVPYRSTELNALYWANGKFSVNAESITDYENCIYDGIFYTTKMAVNFHSNTICIACMATDVKTPKNSKVHIDGEGSDEDSTNAIHATLFDASTTTTAPTISRQNDNLRWISLIRNDEINYIEDKWNTCANKDYVFIIGVHSEMIVLLRENGKLLGSASLLPDVRDLLWESKVLATSQWLFSLNRTLLISTPIYQVLAHLNVESYIQVSTHVELINKEPYINFQKINKNYWKTLRWPKPYVDWHIQRLLNYFLGDKNVGNTIRTLTYVQPKLFISENERFLFIKPSYRRDFLYIIDTYCDSNWRFYYLVIPKSDYDSVESSSKRVITKAFTWLLEQMFQTKGFSFVIDENLHLYVWKHSLVGPPPEGTTQQLLQLDIYIHLFFVTLSVLVWVWVMYWLFRLQINSMFKSEASHN